MLMKLSATLEAIRLFSVLLRNDYQSSQTKLQQAQDMSILMKAAKPAEDVPR